MILLSLKMQIELIFRLTYPLFFEEEDGKPEVWIKLAISFLNF